MALARDATDYIPLGVDQHLSRPRLHAIAAPDAELAVVHQVVNDREFRIWSRYGVQAWPTQVLIDPEGYVVGGISGEGHYDTLDQVIGELVNDHRSRGTLNEEPLRLALEK